MVRIRSLTTKLEEESLLAKAQRDGKSRSGSRCPHTSLGRTERGDNILKMRRTFNEKSEEKLKGVPRRVFDYLFTFFFPKAVKVKHQIYFEKAKR